MRPAASVAFSLVAGLALLAAACGAGAGGEERSQPPESSTGAIEPEYSEGGPDGILAGEWRISSETLFYDAGGSGGSDASASGTRRLTLYDDGSWEFGSSGGAWFTSPIDPSDWDRWGTAPYGPETKIVLEGWNGDVGDGPIEGSAGTVDFFWVIYRVDDPDAGAVQVKFGRT